MLYKRRSVWYIKIKWRGKTIRKSTKTANKDLARRIEAKIKYEIVEGAWFKKDPGESITFREAWEKYLSEETRCISIETYKRAEQAAKRILPFFGNYMLTEIAPAVLSEYKARRLADGITLSTLSKELQFVRRVFSLSKSQWQFVRQSPFEFFRLPRVNDQRVRFLEPGQFKKILQECPSWLKGIVTLAKLTGIRRGNILTLTWSQVDLKNRLISIDHTKNGERLTLPLTESAYDILASIKEAKVRYLDCPFVFHRDGKPFTPNQLSMAFKRASNQAGIEDFRFHDLRHDFASKLVQEGNDRAKVQLLLGHKDERMTQRYVHLKVEHLRSAVDSLEPGHKKELTDDTEMSSCIVNG